MSSVVNTLVEMGFSKQHAEIAVKQTGSSDVQVAMDWLLSHEGQLDNMVSEVPPEQTAPADTEKTDCSDPKEKSPSPTASQDSSSAEAKSFRCDDCGKLFRTQDEVEFHAVKSGHGNFSESTEEKRPLSEEEKKEQLAKIEAKLRQRRLEREAREKEEALMREKIRIKSGKELQEAKRRQEELEMKKLMEQKRREKEEERLAKQRIREKIEQDKIARKAKFGGGSAPAELTPTAPPAAPTPPSATAASPKSSPSEARLQIRLADGSLVQHTFGAKEPLSAVRLFVEMKAGAGAQGVVNLMTNFPKKIFHADDYEKPLETLGLAPSATLFVSKST
ncbi:unnamed protein product [Acanthoscelides obtectus]|uniref:UBX domain-containing protein 1 n=1 Tax=Acanthoscelides obtectus TaxID=200917 RepID=A0A9P0JQE7_ACAOB|nr:unnamed protein product [Acanthoscelides obtectus]CAK1625839.1 UBX domain-containing protein 1 [Acanthoscelides obtectus]